MHETRKILIDPDEIELALKKRAESAVSAAKDGFYLTTQDTLEREIKAYESYKEKRLARQNHANRSLPMKLAFTLFNLIFFVIGFGLGAWIF